MSKKINSENQNQLEEANRCFKNAEKTLKSIYDNLNIPGEELSNIQEKTTKVISE